MLLVQLSAASSSPQTPASSYESVRSLDQYGNAVQLQYARAAADKQGRLIVAIAREKCIWVVSEMPKTRPHQRRAKKHSGGREPLLKAVTSPEPSTVIHKSTMTAPAVYMVSTGIQADAVWLLEQMQTYGKNVAEKYGAYSPTGMAGVVSALKRKFWGYDDDDIWQGDAYRTTVLQGDNDDSWARPLGVRTLVVSFPRPNIQGPVLELVEPSGIVQRGNLFCIGKYNEIVQTELIKKSKSSSSVEKVSDDDLEARLLEAFSSALDHNEPLQLEIVSADGIERRILQK